MELDLKVYGEVDSLYFFFCVLAIKKWRVFECLGLWVLDFLKAQGFLCCLLVFSFRYSMNVSGLLQTSFDFIGFDLEYMKCCPSFLFAWP